METQSSKYAQQAYGIGSIFLMLLPLCFYDNLSSKSYGILLLVIQLTVSYCMLKAHEKINMHSIIKSAIIPTVYFLVVYSLNFLSSMTLKFNELFRVPVFVSFNISLYLLTGCLFLCIAWIGYKGKATLSYKDEKSITGICAFVALSIILCIAQTESITEHYSTRLFFALGLLFMQILYSYNLYKLSKKWFTVGNMLFALFLVSLQMNMLAHYTDLIRNAGWATTYITSVAAELLAMHGCFAILVSLVSYIHHKLHKSNKQVDTKNLTAN